MLSPDDLEGEADRLFAQAGFEVGDVPGALRLARGLLGPGFLREVSSSPTSAAFDAERRQILLRAGLPSTARAFLVAHELAEAHLLAQGLPRTNAEQLADSLAACLLAPRRPFREACAWVGSLSERARLFGISPAVAFLRTAEVTGRPAAMVSPRGLYLRGDPWGWPDEQVLRARDVARHGLEVVELAPQKRGLKPW